MRASPIEAGKGQAKKTGRSSVCGSGVAVGKGAVSVGAGEMTGSGVSEAAAGEVGTGEVGFSPSLPQAEKISRRPLNMNGKIRFKNTSKLAESGTCLKFDLPKVLEKKKFIQP